MTAKASKEIIQQTEAFGAHNYHPLPIVISQADGVWVEIRKAGVIWIC